MINKSLLAALLAAQLLFFNCKEVNTPQEKEVATVSDTVRDIRQELEAVDADTINIEDAVDEEGVNQEECFEKSAFRLPYNKKQAPDKASYKILPCDVEGANEFLCNNRGLRYIALPDYKNVDVVLVPMDCGDFKYRYFLLTVANKKVVSNLYVEGEWYEPGDEEYKETTSFTIDNNYKITVTTNAVENGKSSLKEKKEYQLQENGNLKKL